MTLISPSSVPPGSTTPDPRAPQSSVPQSSIIEESILALTRARGADKSICPSEVARALLPDWQTLMTPVRQAAARLAQAGRIEILRKGKPVDPLTFKGVIRLRIAGGDR